MNANLMRPPGFRFCLNPGIAAARTYKPEVRDGRFSEAFVYYSSVTHISVRQERKVNVQGIPHRLSVYKTMVCFFNKTFFKLRGKQFVRLFIFCINYDSRSVLVNPVDGKQPSEFLCRFDI